MVCFQKYPSIILDARCSPLENMAGLAASDAGDCFLFFLFYLQIINQQVTFLCVTTYLITHLGDQITLTLVTTSSCAYHSVLLLMLFFNVLVWLI